MKLVTAFFFLASPCLNSINNLFETTGRRENGLGVCGPYPARGLFSSYQITYTKKGVRGHE